ncbi:MAG: ankyrin repeat domain-containing protein [Planctomyces sp.]|nr:ankyrin repeat domain-containing protein [Planctomyces sp.]
MTKPESNRITYRPAQLMTQPTEMKTSNYVYGIEPLDGNDAWAMFEASTTGDIAQLEALLKKDHRLVNAQYWYQFPIHRAVNAGHTKIVELLLEAGADPGQSRYTYNSWDKLLLSAHANGHCEIESLLLRTMKERFNYSPDFDRLRDAIIARDSSGIEDVLRQQPELVRASDSLGNNALHWCVITRQLRLIERFVTMGTQINGLRADGQSPVLLAVNGATDYWYRETRGRFHPTLRNTSVLVGSLLALGAEYTVSVAAAVGDQERVEELISRNVNLATQPDSARFRPLSYASRSGYLHIVRLLLDHGADPNAPEECAPEGRALYEACCANHLSVAQLLLERGANSNAGVDSCECCLTISELYHGENAKPLQELLLRHGAYLPPYRMDTDQLKQSIRSGSIVVQHDEFIRCVMQNCDEDLLELLLNSDPTVIARLEIGDELTCLKSPALIEKLLARGLNPTRPNWLGQTLLDTFHERGNDLLPRLFTNRNVDAE